MTDSNTPIVVVAYNRAKSLTRLLKSISNANYNGLSVPLFISIDRAENNQDVLKIAQDFQWAYGRKEVIYNDVNLGLRKHIIKCASISKTYGSVIVLEDDLYVSPCFYVYALQALKFSVDKNYISGISLYNHQLNVHKGVNFSAMEDGYDNWYFQFASSWGQAWTSSQFEEFLNWYQKQSNPLIKTEEVPDYVISWSDKSWLKYYISYLVETNKYFLYPKISLSTNFSDAGTHVGNDSTAYQVPMLGVNTKEFNFSTLEESNSIYDSFYENIKISKHLNIADEHLCIDLAGYRKKYNKRFIITPKVLDFKIIKSYSRSLKPIECNIFDDITGSDIFLYDSEIHIKNSYVDHKKRQIFYYIKFISHRDSLILALELTKQRFKGILKKLF
ncbi:MAG: glycosyltransferase [Sediminicola sp.]